MKILDDTQIMQLLAKTLKKPCMFIGGWNFEDIDVDEILKAAPYLNLDDHAQILADARGYLIFDSEDEMEKYYDMTVGDDGPTDSNDYNGSARVYALTCSAEGELLNENT